MSSPARQAWRVFPWDRQAEAGQPFSASFVPAAQGSGRFDLPGEPTGVLYLAESSDHAVAERIQDLRNQTLDAEDLSEYGHPLALVRVTLAPQVLARVADLCDPTTLAALEVAPDEVCARDRTTTRGISVDLYRAGHAGFRWWSAFFGEWHTLVLFRDRLDPPPAFGEPELLSITHPALARAARMLGTRIVG